MSLDSSSSEFAAVPDPLRRFIELFNEEKFWESHEELEEAWRAGDSDFYHGLILFASAFVHVLRRNPHGVLAQLDKAERCLEGCRPTYLGVDVEALFAQAERCRGVVSRIHPGGGGGGGGGGEGEDLWERVSLPRLGVDPGAVRGDEPELGLDASRDPPSSS